MITKEKPITSPVVLLFQKEGKSVNPEENFTLNLNDDKTKIHLKTGQIQYSGEISEEKTLFLIRNKSTGKVRFVSAEKALMKVELDQDVIDSSLALSADSMFGEKFGSKRYKRTIDQKRKSVIDSDVMKDKLQKAVAAKDFSVEELNEHKAVDGEITERYAPPMNRDAKTPFEVYTMSDILPSNECESLKTLAEQVLDEDVADLQLTDFVHKMIKNLRISSKKNKVLDCCLMLYADCVIRFLNTDYRTLSKKGYVACTYSESVNNLILNYFSSTGPNQARTRSNALKDKAVCYLLVALLLANNFVIQNLINLAPQIHVTLPKLSEITKVIGARTVIDKSSTDIVLKIPLCPPPVTRMKRKR